MTLPAPQRLPAPNEQKAQEAGQALRQLKTTKDINRLPPEVMSVLEQVLQALSQGYGIAIIPERAELTTVQAANILNVSRPYLIDNLLEKGKIPYYKVGSHRRIRMEDVVAYKKKRDEESEKLLDELVAEAQELGLGY
jgi:excisionase family DNA binding protein